MAVNKIIFIALLLIPFQFSLGSLGESDLPIIRIIIPLAFLAWLGSGLVRKNLRLPAPLTLFALTSFLLWVVLSVSWALNPAWASGKIVFWLNFFPLFFILASLFQNEDTRKSALQGLVWGGGLISLVGIIQFMAQFIIPTPLLITLISQSLTFFLGIHFATAVMQYPSFFVNIGGVTFLRAFAFFPDPHIFAYYTAMLTPLAGYLALRAQSSRWEKVLPGILLLAALLTFSRASYVALLVVAGLFLATTFWKYKKNLSVPLVLLVIGLAGILAVSPAAPRLMSSFSEEDGSVQERSRLWQEAITNIQERPLLGVGLGNYPLLVKPSADPREPIYVHNLYLDIAGEVGLIGLALFLLFIASCFPRISFAGAELLSYQNALFLSLSIFLIHSLFEYPLFSVHILPLLLIILALLYVEKTRA